MFSLEVGRLAAAHPQIRRKVLEEGRAIPYFRRDLALQTLASEEDRIKRAEQPLTLPVPGCAL